MTRYLVIAVLLSLATITACKRNPTSAENQPAQAAPSVTVSPTPAPTPAPTPLPTNSDFIVSPEKHERVSANLRQRIRLVEKIRAREKLNFTVRELEDADLKVLERIISGSKKNKGIALFSPDDPNKQGLIATKLWPSSDADFLFRVRDRLLYLRSMVGGCSKGRILSIAKRWVYLPRSGIKNLTFVEFRKYKAITVFKWEDLKKRLSLSDDQAKELWGQSCFCEHDDYDNPPVPCTEGD